MGETTKHKDYPIYDQLCKIFSDSGGIGRYAQSSHYMEMDKETNVVETPQLCHKGTSLSIDPLAPAFGQDDSSSRSGGDANFDARNKRKALGQPSSHKRKRNNSEFDDAITEAMMEMANASKLRVNALIQCGDKFPIAKCIEVLDEISEVDESLYYAALDLFDNPDLREIFLCLKIDKRLIWLQSKCVASCVST